MTNLIWFYFSIHAVRGIEELNQDKGNSFGARFALTPLNNPYTFRKKKIANLIIGFSYNHDFNDGFKTEEFTLAFDFELKVGPVYVNTEYYAKEKYYTIDKINDGYHITGGFDFGAFSAFPMTLYTRYDSFRIRRNDITEAYKTSGQSASRIMGGLNFNINGIFIIKFEYLQFLENFAALENTGNYSDKSFFAQFVISI